MVVVRESPHAKRSPDKNEAQWPPKSPFQALLSSPSGRKRWQERQGHAEDRSPSPSPICKSLASERKLQSLVPLEEDDASEDEDEDEETLQLRLQQIEAKLKLKRLQKARKTVPIEKESSVEADVGALSPSKRGQLAKSSRSRREGTAVEVPLSPIRSQRPPAEQLSPARVKLGLAAANRAQDVSLKRARDSTFARRRDVQHSADASQQRGDLARPKSFGERIVEKERKAEELEARRQHLESVRSSAFKQTAISAPSTRPRQASPSREQGSHTPGHSLSRSRSVGHVSNGTSCKQEPGLLRSASTHSRLAEKRHRSPTKDSFRHRTDEVAMANTGNGKLDGTDPFELGASADTPGYDPFSQIHLSKRKIPHTDIAREMEGKEIYTLPRLLKEVTSPSYDPPDCESDYVVFAILASKSNPFDQATTHRQTDGHAPNNLEAPRNKFMVLHICDLKREIDLFLFGTAFNQFWKLTPGTLLAILNPAIMPPKGNQHNGRFSLKLGSSEDAIMEIGTARDLGYCVSIKKDGQQCPEWIDKRKADACEFHVNLQVEKSRKNRIEINSSWNGMGPKDKAKSRTVTEGEASTGRRGKYHREYGNLYTVKSGMGKSAALLLDDDDAVALNGLTQDEASRQRLAAAQRERDLAKRLGEMGKGVGAEYLRKRHQSLSTTLPGDSAAAERESFFPAKPLAASLGLLSNRAGDARLSPAKDRKRHFGLGAMNVHTGGAEAMGWGGARKVGLLQTNDRSKSGKSERGQASIDVSNTKRAGSIRPRPQDASRGSSMSPTKKRARFALDKGIREPGRESLPGPADHEDVGVDGRTLDGNVDDDDGLDIV